MSKFLLHPEAYADLNEIWDYVAADSPDAADRVLDEIYDAINFLARFPHSGHTLADLTSRPLEVSSSPRLRHRVCSRCETVGHN